MIPLLMSDLSGAVLATAHLPQTQTGLLNEVLAFVRREAPRLAAAPELTLQTALNFSRPGSALAGLASARLAAIAATKPTSVALAVTGGRHEIMFQRLNVPGPTRVLCSLVGHAHYVVDLDFASDQRRLLSASKDGTCRIWDIETVSELAFLRGHEGPVLSAQFDPEGGRVASCGEDGHVRVWDSGSGLETAGLNLNAGLVYWVRWSPDGARLAASCENGSVAILSVAASSAADGAVSLGSVAVLRVGSVPVYSCAWGPAGTAAAGNLVACDKSGAVALFGSKGDTFTQEARDGGGSVACSVTYAPNGKVLFVGSYDHTIHVLDASTLDTLSTVNGGFGWVYRVACCDTGSKLLIGHRSVAPSLATVNGTDVRVTAQLYGHRSFVSGVAFARGSNMFATGSEDRTINVWSVSKDGGGAWQGRIRDSSQSDPPIM